MQALQSAEQMIHASNLSGAADIYAVMLTVKNGFANGSKIGCYSFTLKDLKRAGIEYAFVANACAILGLKLENRHGRHGHSISK